MSTKTERRAKCGTETLLVGTQPYFHYIFQTTRSIDQILLTVVGTTLLCPFTFSPTGHVSWTVNQTLPIRMNINERESNGRVKLIYQYIYGMCLYEIMTVY